MSSVTPILPRSIGEVDVLAKADYFVDVQLWPLQKTLNARGWLGNFIGDEKEHAIHLLNGFLYFSSVLVDQMFAAAFQSLSSRFHTPGSSYLVLQSNWQQFLDTVIVTYVTGERPNPTDSGYSFARKTRQLLGIPETRITSPADAVQRLVHQPGPILFVDDFVGSGNQFVETWRRTVSISGITASFEKIAAVSPASFYYCPVICTEYGYSRLRHDCPTVILQPAHILTRRYSALAPDSFIWPARLQATSVDFLQRASSRAGIPDTGGNVNDWRGFHQLGLALAIGDSVPDATLPIFYWEENGWKPLLKKT
jgi:hypothetical protein